MKYKRCVAFCKNYWMARADLPDNVCAQGRGWRAGKSGCPDCWRQKTTLTFWCPWRRNGIGFLFASLRKICLNSLFNKTNWYARTTDRAWEDTTVEEMKAFIALKIYFDIKELPQTKHYWTKNPLLNVWCKRWCPGIALTRSIRSCT